METVFHTQYSGRVRVQHENLEPSKTKQSFKKDSDINHIIAQYDKTGVLVSLNKRRALEGKCGRCFRAVK